MKVVLSQAIKGGCGKSLMAINIAHELAKEFNVGLLDADIDSPNIPGMLNMKEGMKQDKNRFFIPVEWKPAGVKPIKVASVGLFASLDKYKGPVTMFKIGEETRQIIYDLVIRTSWKNIDYLVVDLPAGCVTGNTLISTVERGPIPIKDIRAGEQVYSISSSIEHTSNRLNEDWDWSGGIIKQPVIDVVYQGKKQTYLIETGSREICATNNHPFLRVQKVSGIGVHMSWVPLKELKVGDLIVMVKSNDELGLETIRSIRESCVEDVYDLKMPIHHNFVANNIVVHNSGDETIAIIETLGKNLVGTVLVTLPITVEDCMRVVDIATRYGIRVLGEIINQDGAMCACGHAPVCPECKKPFVPLGVPAEGFITAEKFAEEWSIPILGKVPLIEGFYFKVLKGEPIIPDNCNQAIKNAVKEIKRFKPCE